MKDTDKIQANAISGAKIQLDAISGAVATGVRRGIQGAFANFALAAAIVIALARYNGWL